MTHRPNILIIMSDQHAPMYSGVYGHSLVQTPHLDRLATQGVVFDAAYCNSPICVPSRMAFMTGRHIQHSGVWDNGVPLAQDAVTWAHLARSQGYDAVLAGKVHFRGLDQRHGFRAQLARDINAENRPSIPDWSQPLPTRPPRTDIVAGPGQSKETETDDLVEARALDYLQDPARREQPWALMVGFVAPHPPYIAPPDYFERYPLDQVDLPQVAGGPLHPANQRLQRWRGLQGAQIPETSIRRARAAYYGLVSYLDAKIGRLLAALDATRQRDNTLVIYTSDHGEMLGEHGLWQKTCFYEHSVRIPLLMSWPGQLPTGHRVAETVSLVDLTATIADVVDAPPLTPLDGTSLLPLARGEATDWPDEALSEYYANGSTRPWAMLRRGRFKLVYSLDEPRELYDVVADPYEMTNLADDPAHAATLTDLTARLLARWNPTELDRRIRQSQAERHLIAPYLFDYLPAGIGGDG